jgi:hypothetical protein
MHTKKIFGVIRLHLGKTIVIKRYLIIFISNYLGRINSRFLLNKRHLICLKFDIQKNNEIKISKSFSIFQI